MHSQLLVPSVDPHAGGGANATFGNPPGTPVVATTAEGFAARGFQLQDFVQNPLLFGLGLGCCLGLGDFGAHQVQEQRE